ncbi:ATP-binding cassette domain-containing protein [Haladaptatus halobius]|uniref:ATP-binding cassette domain-containing protein n=1 Tax=Haladaptatus halobius TaxID=2884875 RepID=UPI001D0B6E5D|nr:ABC transporter ATP-binding protein [Haladaptatus halobius]
MEADEARSIRIDGLRREFGAITALDGVTLDIEEPQIVGVAGPNGSGKTTLIRTLLGTLLPTSGSVEVNGIDPLSFTGTDRARLGYMPQNETVYPDLMVRENVTFFARLYGVENVADAVDRVLGFVDLSGRRNSLVGDLSGGMGSTDESRLRGRPSTEPAVSGRTDGRSRPATPGVHVGGISGTARPRYPHRRLDSLPRRSAALRPRPLPARRSGARVRRT